jgi:hypothetical protein
MQAEPIELRNAFAAFLGDKRFAKFVAAGWRRGRLRIGKSSSGAALVPPGQTSKRAWVINWNGRSTTRPATPFPSTPTTG